jgi:cobaltochelatase CobS
MFDHTTTLDASHHQRLNKICKVLNDLRSEGDIVTPAHRSKLALLATMYRMSATMPEEAKVSLWLHGPNAGAATLSQGDIESMSAKVIEDLRGDIEDLKALVASTQTITHQITINDGDPIQIKGRVHEVFHSVLDWVAMGEPAYIVGPAGSGKTSIAKQIAEALGTPFYCYGAIGQAFEFLGYNDANGNYVETEFYKAFKHGGLVLMDEMDASNPNALLSLNAALANDFASFPCGLVERHADFRIIASANTFGHGASAQYVGRNPMDAATLDRFAYIPMGYDEALERSIAGNDAWVDLVQAIRAQVEHHKMRFVVSPRASIKGAKALAAGMEWRSAMDALIFDKGWSDTDKTKVLGGVDFSIIDALQEAA